MQNDIIKTRDNTLILLTNRSPPLITVNEISEVVLLQRQVLYRTFKQIPCLKLCILKASCDVQVDHVVQFYIRTVSQQTPTNADKVRDLPYTFLSIRGWKTFLSQFAILSRNFCILKYRSITGWSYVSFLFQIRY
jgi:hypothetical protein